MKRILYLVISLLFLVFVVISVLRFLPTQVSYEKGDVHKALIDKENIQRFWEIYRQATQQRIAGNLKEAAEAYEKALALNDQHEDALYYLGNVYLELENYQGAEKAWKQLVHINPHSSRAHFQLGDLYLTFDQKNLFNIDSAEGEFKRTLQINKEETAPVLRLGEIALIRNQLSEAGNFFKAVTASNEKSVEAYFLHGFIAWKSGNNKLALNRLIRAAQFSDPVQPANGVPGEGDNKLGHQTELPQNSKHQPVFKNYFKGLSGLDSLSLLQQMDNRFKNLDVFLEEIRKQSSSLLEEVTAIN